MKNYEYIISFVSGLWEVVHADSERAAKILAQAEQIKKGNNCEVSNVTMSRRINKL